MLGAIMFKIVSLVFGTAAIVAAVTEVTGDNPHTILNTILNAIGSVGAIVAFQLYQKITKGDTPGTDATKDLQVVVLDLKETVLDLRGELLHTRRQGDTTL